MNRRDVIKAGIGTALGVALAPSLANAAPRSSAIEALRADYLARVRATAGRAVSVRPGIATEGDDDQAREAAAFWLEALCREALCATADDAWTVLLASPHRPAGLAVLGGLSAAEDVRDDAAIVAAHDVADALGAGWYGLWQAAPEVGA